MKLVIFVDVICVCKRMIMEECVNSFLVILYEIMFVVLRNIFI